MTGAFFFTNAFFTHYFILSPTSTSGYVLLRFACKDIFNLTSNSCFGSFAWDGVN